MCLFLSASVLQFKNVSCERSVRVSLDRDMYAMRDTPDFFFRDL